ncbi:probable 39S ribosomal protein L23, mitochondrial [Trichogramma pretiosum]|uniref:probable 39S ribosomal protein L23, mitochondrial n=1 Tax=Trichogramma pretiosum TaxID=7493 RepID=UPI0006C96F9E|nr:probable 39S ribosomal protein L23, mitochondrial [Trichogramma pretiosum]
MSTRWYPIYQKGNPQLRVFLPNFWLKLVKPELKHKPNVVEFHCSMEMTKEDVKNYIEKIYKVPVVKVNTRIASGKCERNELGYVVKRDDVKHAYVTLPRYEKFEYPQLFDNENRLKEKEKDDKSYKEATSEHKNEMDKLNKTTPGYSPWFTI